VIDCAGDNIIKKETIDIANYVNRTLTDTEKLFVSIIILIKIILFAFCRFELLFLIRHFYRSLKVSGILLEIMYFLY
jgi:hypothetical protein